MKDKLIKKLNLFNFYLQEDLAKSIDTLTDLEKGLNKKGNIFLPHGNTIESVIESVKEGIASYENEIKENLEIIQDAEYINECVEYCKKMDVFNRNSTKYLIEEKEYDELVDAKEEAEALNREHIALLKKVLQYGEEGLSIDLKFADEIERVLEKSKKVE